MGVATVNLSGNRGRSQRILTVMEPTVELLRQLETEDLEQARSMSIAEKFRAGGDLFDDACRWTLAGIKAQFPGISPSEARAELLRRLED